MLAALDWRLGCFCFYFFLFFWFCCFLAVRSTDGESVVFFLCVGVPTLFFSPPRPAPLSCVRAYVCVKEPRESPLAHRAMKKRERVCVRACGNGREIREKGGWWVSAIVMKESLKKDFRHRVYLSTHSTRQTNTLFSLFDDSFLKTI